MFMGNSIQFQEKKNSMQIYDFFREQGFFSYLCTPFDSA